MHGSGYTLNEKSSINIYIKNKDVYSIITQKNFVSDHPPSTILWTIQNPFRIGRIGNMIIYLLGKDNFKCRNCDKKLKENILFYPYNINYVLSPYCSIECAVVNEL